MLTRIRIEGFKSLRSLDLTGLGPITVLIGPNGSGKSNLLAALNMAAHICNKSLRLFVGTRGGASRLLHYGPRVTPELMLALEFEQDGAGICYEARLGHASGDTLVFLQERVGARPTADAAWEWTPLGAGHGESRLDELGATSDVPAVRTARWWLERTNFFHFHDTSSSSQLRTNARAVDSHYLRADGSNLAALLLALHDSEERTHQVAWKRITRLTQRVAPFIKELVPTRADGGAVQLDWIDDHNERFAVDDLSDGTLRALAMFTALGQPTEKVPRFVSIDEPELGLHPAALGVLVGLLRSVSAHRQVLLATQSPALLDHFEANEVVVAERRDHQTTFKRLDPTELTTWLDTYRLSELFDKNVLGGRP